MTDVQKMAAIINIDKQIEYLEGLETLTSKQENELITLKAKHDELSS